MDDAWEAVTKPYVLKCKVRIADFECYTFYGDQEVYLKDYHNKWIGLKELLFQKAVDSVFQICFQIFMLMLRQIRYFQAVVRNNSFSEGAYACNILQSAISQQVQALENELGFLLLEC